MQCTECSTWCHVLCLSQWFHKNGDAGSSLMPRGGICPLCSCWIDWPKVIAQVNARYESKPGANIQNVRRRKAVDCERECATDSDDEEKYDTHTDKTHSKDTGREHSTLMSRVEAVPSPSCESLSDTGSPERKPIKPRVLEYVPSPEFGDSVYDPRERLNDANALESQSSSEHEEDCPFVEYHPEQDFGYDSFESPNGASDADDDGRSDALPSGIQKLSL